MSSASDTQNPSRPYKDESTLNLLRRGAVVASMRIPPVNRGIAAVMEIADRNGDEDVATLLKGTAGKIFLGGETLEEAEACCREQLTSGRGVIIDYLGDEKGEKNEASIQKTLGMLLGSATMAGRLHTDFPNAPVSLAMKCSTIASEDDLRHLSTQLQEARDRACKLPGAEDYDFARKFPWQIEPSELDPRAQAIAEKLQGSVDQVLEKARQSGVRVFMDAEYTWMNPAIEYMCFHAPPINTCPSRLRCRRIS